ncbi:CD225/dispanin family protein [Corynebacterium sp. H128]|uniref:CD225/dispanin family protein n=1 Tax=Corynebacterium sp. H128 TaxID=3133427 RepID=UPI003097C4E2
MTTPQNPFNGDNNNSGQGDATPYGGASYGQDATGAANNNAYGTAGSYPNASYANQQPAGERPQNYLVWAILSTVLCCLPAGIVSIIFATQVNSKYDQGDYAGALASSKKAKNWAIISAVIGVILIIISIILQVVAGGLAGYDTSSM